MYIIKNSWKKENNYEKYVYCIQTISGGLYSRQHYHQKYDMILKNMKLWIWWSVIMIFFTTKILFKKVYF